MADYPQLTNAPLLEVIAEVHWQLTDKGSMPDQFVQQDWFLMANEIQDVFRSRWPEVEVLQRAGVSIPLEIIGRAPILRFREEQGKWPLAQLGQGLLTVNATPPYDGWRRVRQTLQQTLERAIESPRLREKKLERLQLQYRDAFTAEHGVEGPSAFTQAIPLASDRLPKDLADIVTPSSTKLSGEISFEIMAPPASQAIVRFASGLLKNEKGERPAHVVDIIIRSQVNMDWNVDKLVNWFDSAHESSHRVFRASISETTWDRLND